MDDARREALSVVDWQGEAIGVAKRAHALGLWHSGGGSIEQKREFEVELSKSGVLGRALFKLAYASGVAQGLSKSSRDLDRFKDKESEIDHYSGVIVKAVGRAAWVVGGVEGSHVLWEFEWNISRSLSEARVKSMGRFIQEEPRLAISHEKRSEQGAAERFDAMCVSALMGSDDDFRLHAKELCESFKPKVDSAASMKFDKDGQVKKALLAQEMAMLDEAMPVKAWSAPSELGSKLAPGEAVKIWEFLSSEGCNPLALETARAKGEYLARAAMFAAAAMGTKDGALLAGDDHRAVFQRIQKTWTSSVQRNEPSVSELGQSMLSRLAEARQRKGSSSQGLAKPAG